MEAMANFQNKFSSNTVEWPTPQWLFDEADSEFNFTLDVCATAENAKCATFFTDKDDGLSQVWSGVCWMNPPYGRRMVKWLEKAVQSAMAGATVVALIPARTNTSWWHCLCRKYGEIRFIRGRPKFGDAVHGLPQPLALVIFKPGKLIFNYDDHKRRHKLAVTSGRIGGQSTSDAKRRAVRENGKLGGRPKGSAKNKVMRKYAPVETAEH